jgi:hypothetical protein
MDARKGQVNMSMQSIKERAAAVEGRRQAATKTVSNSPDLKARYI